MISATICCDSPMLNDKLWHNTYLYSDAPPLPIDHYGVCDDLSQVLRACPLLEESQDREFLITALYIDKADEPERDGWRWHKWGTYIGKRYQVIATVPVEMHRISLDSMLDKDARFDTTQTMPGGGRIVGIEDQNDQDDSDDADWWKK